MDVIICEYLLNDECCTFFLNTTVGVLHLIFLTQHNSQMFLCFVSLIKWTFECKSHLLSRFLHFSFQHFIRYYLKVWLCFNLFFIQFPSLDLDQAMFQPHPSEIVFQNYSPFKTYKVPLELRNSDKVTLILLRRLYSQFVAQLHNECF